MSTILLTLLILVPIATIGLVVTIAAIRKSWIISQLLNEGKIDQALRSISSYKKKEKLAKRLLHDGQISQGLHVLQRIGNDSYIQQYIYSDLPIPKKIYHVNVGLIFKKMEARRSSLADLLYDAARQLLTLKQRVDVMHNPYIPESLKNGIRIGLDDGFFILWDTCHRLALIDMQRLPIKESDIKEECDEIKKLIVMSNQAEEELSQLTRERDATRMKSYQETFRRFTEEAQEIRNAKRLLEESPNKVDERKPKSEKETKEE